MVKKKEGSGLYNSILRKRALLCVKRVAQTHPQEEHQKKRFSMTCIINHEGWESRQYTRYSPKYLSLTEVSRIKPATHVTVYMTGKPAQVYLSCIPVQTRVHTRNGIPYV